jgi:hypothetical protein
MGDGIQKQEVALFVAVLVVGVLIYFLLFADRVQEDSVAEEQQVTPQTPQEPSEPVQEGSGEGTEETEDLTNIISRSYTLPADVEPIATSGRGDSALGITGADLENLYVYALPDQNSLLLRVTSYEELNPELMYIFLFDVDNDNVRDFSFPYKQGNEPGLMKEVKTGSPENVMTTPERMAFDIVYEAKPREILFILPWNALSVQPTEGAQDILHVGFQVMNDASGAADRRQFVNPNDNGEWFVYI